MIGRDPARIGNERVRCHGTVVVGSARVECFVLDSGDRIIDLRSAVRCLTERDHAGLNEYPTFVAAAPLLEADLLVHDIRSFRHPISRKVVSGITAQGFLDICRAYVLTVAHATLTTRRQEDIVTRCAAILNDCADAGLVALIDRTADSGAGFV